MESKCGQYKCSLMNMPCFVCLLWFVLSRQWHVAPWDPDKTTRPPAAHLLLCQLGGEQTRTVICSISPRAPCCDVAMTPDLFVCVLSRCAPGLLPEPLLRVAPLQAVWARRQHPWVVVQVEAGPFCKCIGKTFMMTTHWALCSQSRARRISLNRELSWPQQPHVASCGNRTTRLFTAMIIHFCYYKYKLLLLLFLTIK